MSGEGEAVCGGKKGSKEDSKVSGLGNGKDGGATNYERKDCSNIDCRQSNIDNKNIEISIKS